MLVDGNDGTLARTGDHVAANAGVVGIEKHPWFHTQHMRSPSIDNTTMAGHRHSLTPMPGNDFVQRIHDFGAKAFKVDTADLASHQALPSLVVVFLHLFFCM